MGGFMGSFVVDGFQAELWKVAFVVVGCDR